MKTSLRDAIIDAAGDATPIATSADNPILVYAGADLGDIDTTHPVSNANIGLPLYYKLVQDVTTAVTMPLGFGSQYPQNSSFSGTFDGAGHTVKLNIIGSRMGLVISHTNDRSAGLFAFLTGTVKNLKLTGKVEFTIPGEYAAGCYMTVGSVAGILSRSGLILNVANTADVKITNASAQPSYIAVGGIAGYLDANANLTCNIYNCYSAGDVSLADNTGLASCSVGGIAGVWEGSICAMNFCYAEGSVTLTGVTNNTGNVGGIGGAPSNGGTLSSGVVRNMIITTSKPTADSLGRVYGYYMSPFPTTVKGFCAGGVTMYANTTTPVSARSPSADLFKTQDGADFTPTTQAAWEASGTAGPGWTFAANKAAATAFAQNDSGQLSYWVSSAKAWYWNNGPKLWFE